jgi:hypothetical protein
MGLDSVFFARIDGRDRDQRRAEKTMEVRKLLFISNHRRGNFKITLNTYDVR